SAVSSVHSKKGPPTPTRFPTTARWTIPARLPLQPRANRRTPARGLRERRLEAGQEEGLLEFGLALGLELGDGDGEQAVKLLHQLGGVDGLGDALVGTELARLD